MKVNADPIRIKLNLLVVFYKTSNTNQTTAVVEAIAYKCVSKKKKRMLKSIFPRVAHNNC